MVMVVMMMTAKRIDGEGTRVIVGMFGIEALVVE